MSDDKVDPKNSIGHNYGIFDDPEEKDAADIIDIYEHGDSSRLGRTYRSPREIRGPMDEVVFGEERSKF